MAMFPDSGVPPADAINSLPDVDTQGCNELWYSTSRCQPRFDPAAANAMLAEMMNLINKGEVSYKCTALDNVEHAVRYLIQRGLPCGVALDGGPFDYTCQFDPTLTRYNNFLTAIVVPAMTNQGAVRINSDSLGLVPVLRNDSLPLQSADLRSGIPALISFNNGNWYHVGLCPSQVPLVVLGQVDIWIRTDGNDTTGDGGANSPERAFRTIQGAWDKVGSRYAATPLLTMNFKLGIPGTYAGASMGPFGGGATLSGAGSGTKLDYKITSIDFGNNIWGALFIHGMSALGISNLTLIRDVSPPHQPSILRCDGSAVVISNIDFDSTVANSSGNFIHVLNGSCGASAGAFTFNGRNLALGSIVRTELSGVFVGCFSVLAATYNFVECAFTNAFNATAISVQNWQASTLIDTSCAGSKYVITENSIINMHGQTPPGTTAGAVSSGGQFIP